MSIDKACTGDLIAELMARLPNDEGIELVINQHHSRIRAFGREFQCLPTEATKVIANITELADVELA